MKSRCWLKRGSLADLYTTATPLQPFLKYLRAPIPCTPVVALQGCGKLCQRPSDVQSDINHDRAVGDGDRWFLGTPFDEAHAFRYHWGRKIIRATFPQSMENFVAVGAQQLEKGVCILWQLAADAITI